MDVSWDEVREVFLDAGEWFVQLVAEVGDRWDEPGLGEWDVRALVGHTTRAFLTVETYLDQPASAIEVETPVEYFRAVRRFATGADSAEVAQRGRDAGTALGDDP